MKSTRFIQLNYLFETIRVQSHFVSKFYFRFSSICFQFLCFKQRKTIINGMKYQTINGETMESDFVI